MSFKDDLRNKLGEDMFNEVADKLGDGFNYDVVPRTRLNEVIKARDGYKSQLEDLSGGTQHQNNGGNPNGSSSGNQKPQQQSVDIEELKKQWEADKNKELSALKIRYAGLDALRNAGAVDPEVAFSLLDQSKITMDDKGVLTGLQEQIDAQKESKKYLYPGNNGGRSQTPGGTGKNGGTDKLDEVKSKADFLKLSYEDQIKFKEVHPKIFQQYLNS